MFKYVHMDASEHLTKWFLKEPIEKAMQIEEAVAQAQSLTEAIFHPAIDRSDLQVLRPEEHPEKPGLGTIEGHGRLLHDLANIELQAMELCVRTLVEFPEASREFREELAKIAVDEARHFLLCCETMTDAEMTFGDCPIHLSLWEAANDDQDLLARIMTVHRYLEPNGLDAGESILKRLVGSPVKNIASRQAIDIIVRDEVEHVAFGSKWFAHFCEERKLIPFAEFKRRYQVLARKIPRREKPAFDLRLRGGFSEEELKVLGYEKPVLQVETEPEEFGFLKINELSY